MKRSISIIGAGNVGTAFAAMLSHHKRPVKIYCIERDVEDDINCRRINSKYLHGVKLPPNVSATASIKESLEGADIVIVAVPRFALPEVYAAAAPHIASDSAIGVLTKGLDQHTGEPCGALFCATPSTQVTKTNRYDRRTCHRQRGSQETRRQESSSEEKTKTRFIR